ncbi:MAG: hypothetical protein IPH62_13820 [Ignavibacteriae bacterium]|nr:hypothetical protein [Ignavibacteriota bacterium]
MKIFIARFVILFIAISCNPDETIVEPKFADSSILEGTIPLTEIQKNKIEGVYNLVSGKEKFGGSLVLKSSGNSLSIFGVKLGTYFILNCGSKDGELFFEGSWRYAQSTEVGLVRLTLTEANGSSSILSDTTISNIKLTGKFSEGDDNLDNVIELEFSRKFSGKIYDKNFYILAHRGGGRNSDNLGASENSIEIIGKSENLGANGIEIDVKLSEDNIPFLYHDVSLNLRTSTDSPIWGPVEDFSFSQLSSFIKLKNGEKIPSLDEALNFIVHETNLKVVWLDMKSEKNSVPYVVPIQQKYLKIANELGKQIQIFIGLPDETMYNNFVQYSDYENTLSLCELSIDYVQKASSNVWAPRWTLGLQNSEIDQLHNANKLVFTWTLDQSQFINEFIANGSFDGILTNYPTLVAYYFYAQE